MIQLWFTFANQQCVSQNDQFRHRYLHIEVTEHVSHICTFNQHNMFTCRLNKHTQRPLVETENAITNCENSKINSGVKNICFYKKVNPKFFMIVDLL